MNRTLFRHSPAPTALCLRWGAALALLSLSTQAAAHIVVTEPEPRLPGEANIKTAPCQVGNSPSSWGQGEVHVVAPGASLQVTWDETIPHAGYYRIALSPTGDDGLTMPSEEDFDAFVQFYQSGAGTVPDPLETPEGTPDGSMIVYYDYYKPHPGGTCAGDDAGGCEYSVTVTLPQECEQCTLQVVQTMSEPGRVWGSNAHYYHCIDISIDPTLGGGTDSTSIDDESDTDDMTSSSVDTTGVEPIPSAPDSDSTAPPVDDTDDTTVDSTSTSDDSDANSDTTTAAEESTDTAAGGDTQVVTTPQATADPGMPTQPVAPTAAPSTPAPGSSPTTSPSTAPPAESTDATGLAPMSAGGSEGGCTFAPDASAPGAGMFGLLALAMLRVRRRLHSEPVRRRNATTGE